MDQPVPESVEEAFASLSDAAPQGWRVELIEGEIHVTPPANGDHAETMTEVAYQVARQEQSAQLRVYTGIGLVVPYASMPGRVIPDLVVARKGSFANSELYLDP